MPSNKVMDLLFGLLMQILEFVHSREFGNIETIGKHAIGLSFQKMLAFICSDMRDGSKDIAGMCGCPLNAVPMVDTTFSSLMIYIKVL